MKNADLNETWKSQTSSQMNGYTVYKQNNKNVEMVPKEELQSRAAKLRLHLGALSLDGALILDPLHMYYFTGTMQQGIVVIPVAKDPIFFVRRNIERARMESTLSDIRPLAGLSQLTKALRDEGVSIKTMGLATAQITMDLHAALAKSLPSTAFVCINRELAMVRAVKSPYEISLIRRAGECHQLVYDQIPAMIQENMSEWQLGCKIQAAMMELGYTGMPKFSGANMDIFLGYVSAGVSANYPTGFSGPGGAKGLSPTIPYVGSQKKIQANEPIYIDTGFCFHGYHTDKTRILCLGALPDEVLEAHAHCLHIQEELRRRLQPGAIPAQIYAEIMDTLVNNHRFAAHFMGYGDNQVPFLGHGIGLAIDEWPVIAAKMEAPLAENMVIALEPKKALPGVGMVGIENTFRVTEQGGENLTPGSNQVVFV